ncbi:MAG: 16S rRNA (cytosine(1402)-N(4))-methyltransferase RsmH [Coriobacteriia bacterium]|nr:16S rRNA (cytosine(1402)-N(4))-methyltransferase RsmH [Coriobacteriia bacterium]
MAEVTQQLNPSPGSIVVDCTLGYGGHAGSLLPHIAPRGTFIGIDQDDAPHHTTPLYVARLGQHFPHELARRHLSASSLGSSTVYESPHDSFLDDTYRAHGPDGVEIITVKGNFGDLDTILTDTGIPYADIIFFDIGVSSPQLDDPARGFSFRVEGPLDMRMDPSAPRSAADLIAQADETELARIIATYGEERWASRIAQFIVAARGRAPIETTTQLVDIIKDAIPASARRAGGHPAKRTFQALRIAVNDELGVLERGLEAAIRWLRPGGRVGVITFHSLEDRIVKRTFAEHAHTCICPDDLPICACGHTPILEVITRKAIRPGAQEREDNPRAASAKLRVARKR